jgi:presenilin-like A22 family membrane protease
MLLQEGKGYIALCSRQYMKRNLMLQLAAVFLLTQLLGLYVADFLVQSNVTMQLPAGGREDIGNSIFLFAYIMFFTLILLGIIRFTKGRLLYYILKFLESLAVFMAATIVFASVYDSLIVIIPALGIVGARLLMPQRIILRNVATALAVTGVGALIGVSLAPVPILVFMLLLAAYDYLAVFKTRHMVRIAKAVSSRNLAFSYALPTKEHKFELGTGDLVIPLAFSASVLAEMKLVYAFPFYVMPSLVILLASIIGLKITMDVVAEKPGKALPALPVQVMLMAFAYVVMVIAGII